MLIARNMVCHRCKAVVKRVLLENGIDVEHVDPGEAELGQPGRAPLDHLG